MGDLFEDGKLSQPDLMGNLAGIGLTEPIGGRSLKARQGIKGANHDVRPKKFRLNGGDDRVAAKYSHEPGQPCRQNMMPG